MRLYWYLNTQIIHLHGDKVKLSIDIYSFGVHIQCCRRWNLGFDYKTVHKHQCFRKQFGYFAGICIHYAYYIDRFCSNLYIFHDKISFWQNIDSVHRLYWACSFVSEVKIRIFQVLILYNLDHCMEYTKGSWYCHHAPIWYLRQFLRHNISKNHRKPLNYFLSWYRIFLVQYIYWILTSFYKFFDSLALYPFGQFLAFPYLCHWSFHFYDVWYCDKIWSSYLLYSPLQKFCNNKIYRIYSSVNWN